MKRSISSSASIPVNRFYKEAKQLVVRMTGVDEIDLCLAIFTEIEYLPKLHFTKDLLRVSSDNIRKLYLDCALDSLGHAMDVDLILPRLSTLRLSLRIVFPCSQPHKLISPIKDFLVNNHLSITDLELYFSHTVNPANFVQNLPTFPLLFRLLLAFPILDPSKQHLQNLTKFISQHELQLSALDLYVKKNPFHFQNSIPVPTMFEIGATSVLVGFPKLADLTLNMYPMWISGINNKQYIGRYQSTLESLQLQTCVLTFTDLEELFFHTNFSRLRCLALTLTCLSPRHLSLFADTLPGLKHLLFHVTLHVTSNPHADTQQAAPLPPFSLDVPLVLNTSSRWGLTCIILPSNPHLKDIPVQDRKALVSALPNVRSFCEVDPDEYATAVDDPGVALKRKGGYWGARYCPDFYPAQ
ncbi:hypothetical protein BJ165DRAFT_1530082 [Panaeolus papilionaceus]|nr:hypothetical protein BJ165DRAFT_1530082 [Panaeolus papilionaceus]